MGPGRVFAIDILPNRLALAEKSGAEIIDASKTDVVSEILSRTDMNGVDVDIEAAGLPMCFTQGLNILRRGGSLSVVGLFPGSVQLNLPILGLSEAMEAYDLFENHKDECIKVMLKP